jgi:6,7-dimethyl-8-ribityllumazine synthase
MAAKQEANVRHGSVVAKPNQKYGVVVGRFNDLVTKLLLEGAYGAFESHGVSLSNVEVRMWRYYQYPSIASGTTEAHDLVLHQQLQFDQSSS